jgi:hypothetical protein
LEAYSPTSRTGHIFSMNVEFIHINQLWICGTRE